MNFQDIVNQLNDVPSTFRREGTPYTWVIDALTVGLYFLCSASDSLLTQYNFNTSQGGWIDVWGALAGFTRTVNESDDTFRTRIQQTLIGWRDSPVALETFITAVESLSATIVETSGAYSIQIAGVTDVQAAKLANDIKYIRPAGVPFTIQDTNASVTRALAIPSATTSTQRVIPELLFEDPVLNP